MGRQRLLRTGETGAGSRQEVRWEKRRSIVAMHDGVQLAYRAYRVQQMPPEAPCSEGTRRQ